MDYPLYFHGLGWCYFEDIAIREPKRGEWYLSGAILEGRKTRYDFDVGDKFGVVRPTYFARKQIVFIKSRAITTEELENA